MSALQVGAHEPGPGDEPGGTQLAAMPPAPPRPSFRDTGYDTVHRLGDLSVEVARTPLRLLAPLAEPLRADVHRSIRRALGVPPDAQPSPERPGKPFLPPDAVTRRVHGDLPSMMIGGLAALLLQTLHPLAMAGVTEHSAYAVDPLGRLRRTAAFVGATTFGTEEDADRAIALVLRVHESVHGRAPDGRPYSAADPELVTWVHTAEMSSFLAAARRFGVVRLAPGDADRYYAETATVARRLGAEWVPTSEAEVEAYFQRLRPTLYAGAQAYAARDFLLRGVGRRMEDRVVHACLGAAATGLLPPWARHELSLPAPPFVDTLVVTPVARTLCQGLRWAVPPP